MKGYGRLLVLVIVVAGLAGSSSAQEDYATLTLTRDGDGGWSRWSFDFESQLVTAIELRYRAMNANSVGPDFLLACRSAHEGNADPDDGFNDLTAQLVQPLNQDWNQVTLDLTAGQTTHCCRFDIDLDDNTSGTSDDKVGIDLDYIILDDGTSTTELSLQDDGTRSWAGRLHSGEGNVYPHGVIVGGTYGTVAQLDFVLNPIEEQGYGRFFWDDWAGAVNSITYPQFEWVWRAAPGDATNNVDIRLYFSQADYGWDRPPGCDWGWHASQPLMQQPEDWEARVCTFATTEDYIGHGWVMSDSAVGSGLSGVMQGVQIDTFTFLDGVGGRLLVMDHEPIADKSVAGSAFLGGLDYLHWDTLADYTDPAAVGDWMFY